MIANKLFEFILKHLDVAASSAFSLLSNGVVLLISDDFNAISLFSLAICIFLLVEFKASFGSSFNRHIR